MKIKMVIPIFKGCKGENPEIFKKRACIKTWLKTIIKWFFFP